MRAGFDTEKIERIYANVARRYDRQHALLTLRSDQRGRAMLVEKTVHGGDTVLDCGAGTGTTAILAARKAGRDGRVTLFDLSDAMLEVARGKVVRAGIECKVEFRTGDMVHLPFDDDTFDVVLSTYSLCPLYDPARGALEMFRVTRPGGVVGVAHSTEPEGRLTRALADRVEAVAWRFPGLSMGCRAVDVLPALEKAGGRVLFQRRIGIPLWPFLVFAVRKLDE